MAGSGGAGRRDHQGDQCQHDRLQGRGGRSERAHDAGGVTVSYYEWARNLQQYRWTHEQVNRELKATLTKAYVSVRDLANEKTVTFRTAAYGIALQRVADAERLRGN